MNSPTQIRDLDFSTPAFLRLRSFNDSWLLTNQVGGYIFLNQSELARLRSGELEDQDELYERLADADLISVDIDIDEMADQMTRRQARLVHKPALHRIVVTEKTALNGDGDHMSIMVAEQVINLITETNSASVSIIFWGNPFLNWPVVQHCIEGLEMGFENRRQTPVHHRV